MTSWKTTLSGAVTAAAGLVIALNSAGVGLPKWLVVTAGFVAAGGVGFLGKFSKDVDVHSTAAQVHESTIKQVQNEISTL
jgi:hypothetical protein